MLADVVQMPVLECRDLFEPVPIEKMVVVEVPKGGGKGGRGWVKLKTHDAFHDTAEHAKSMAKQ